jgi:glutathione S-transferase
MKLFWCPQTRSQRALWLLEEAGVDYERVLIDIRDPSKPRDPDFAKASPMGKVPAIADGAAMLADSAAICMYVADKYPQTKLAPATDDPARAQYYWWMIFTPGVIEPAMAEKFSGAEPNPLSHAWGSFDLMIETFEKGVGDGPWILGDQFSAADIMVGSSACFLKQFGILPDSKILEAYGERCMARPAYQRAAELSVAA